MGLLVGITLLAAAAVLGLQPGSSATRGVGTVPAAGAPSPRSVPLLPPGLGLATPVGVRVDALSIDAPVIPVGVDNTAQMQVPDPPTTLGWWRGGARPGAPAGTVVIVGHVDSATRGLGALFHLDRLAIGSPVVVRTRTGNRHYRAVARRVYRKNQLPAELFATTGRPRLVLITCGGSFNHATHHYADNLVVYAVPEGRPDPHRL